MDTAVLFITTHGTLRDITLENNEVTILPEGLQVYGIESTDMGVVNMVGDEHVENIFKILEAKTEELFHNQTKRLTRSVSKELEIGLFLGSLRELFLEEAVSIRREIKKDIESGELPQFKDDNDVIDYLHTSNFYNIYDYNRIAPPSKIFLRNREDLVGHENPRMWTMTALLPSEDGIHEVDFLDAMFKTRSTRRISEGISLTELLNKFHELFPRITNLLIVDLSCNYLDGDFDSEVTRNVRSTRRRVTRERRDSEIHGKIHKTSKGKRRRRKTKNTKKNKK